MTTKSEFFNAVLLILHLRIIEMPTINQLLGLISLLSVLVNRIEALILRQFNILNLATFFQRHTLLEAQSYTLC